MDGAPLDELGARTLDLTIAVAGGQRSLGERAGHYQVQIWRDWQHTRPVNVTVLEDRSYSGEPLDIAEDVHAPSVSIPVYESRGQVTTEQVGMVLPTSLCSGQIARITTDTLNRTDLADSAGLSRFVTLVHTEGCGGTVVPEYKDTLISYLQHPKLRHALLLEHGCEITHNSYFRQLMGERGLDPADYGWASIQLDGGINSVMQKMVRWFRERIDGDSVPSPSPAGMEALRLGLLSAGTISDGAARGLSDLCKMIARGGGTVVVSDKDSLLEGAFMRELGINEETRATLGYGQLAAKAGFHVMASPRQHWSETLTGLGAAGVELMLGVNEGYALAGHPLVPVLQVTFGAGSAEDLDAVLPSDRDPAATLLDLIVDTLRGDHVPKHELTGTHDFQVTRGMIGVSF